MAKKNAVHQILNGFMISFLYSAKKLDSLGGRFLFHRVAMVSTKKTKPVGEYVQHCFTTHLANLHNNLVQSNAHVSCSIKNMFPNGPGSKIVFTGALEHIGK